MWRRWPPPSLIPLKGEIQRETPIDEDVAIFISQMDGLSKRLLRRLFE